MHKVHKWQFSKIGSESGNKPASLRGSELQERFFREKISILKC